MQRLHEDAPLAGEQRVDRVQPRHGGRRRRAGVEPVGAGEPAEPVEADVERDEGDPERRHRDAAERDDAQHVVGRAVAAHRRDDAEGDAEERGDQDGVERQLRGRGNELAEVVRDRVVRQRRLAEVSLREVLEVDRVADGQRPVEAVLVLEGRDGRRIRRRLLAEVRRRRIAWHELREDEGDERDPDPEEHERREPPQEEAEEARRRARHPAPAEGRLRVGRDGRHVCSSSRAQKGRPTRSSKRT